MSNVNVPPKAVDKKGAPVGDPRKLRQLPDGRVEGSALDLVNDSQTDGPKPPEDAAAAVTSEGQPTGGATTDTVVRDGPVLVPAEREFARESLAQAAHRVTPQKDDLTPAVRPDFAPAGDRLPGIEATPTRALARDILNRSPEGVEAEMAARYPDDPNTQRTPAPQTEAEKKDDPHQQKPTPGFVQVRVLKKGDGQVSKGYTDPANGAQAYYAKGDTFTVAESIGRQLEDRGFVEVED